MMRFCRSRIFHEAQLMHDWNYIYANKSFDRQMLQLQHEQAPWHTPFYGLSVSFPSKLGADHHDTALSAMQPHSAPLRTTEQQLRSYLTRSHANIHTDPARRAQAAHWRHGADTCLLHEFD